MNKITLVWHHEDIGKTISLPLAVYNENELIFFHPITYIENGKEKLSRELLKGKEIDDFVLGLLKFEHSHGTYRDLGHYLIDCGCCPSGWENWPPHPWLNILSVRIDKIE